MAEPHARWPKILPSLSREQQERNDEFMKLWHQELAGRSRYRVIENFNHNFPVQHTQPGFRTTLELGAGLGEHILYERLTAEQEQHYYANDARPNMAAEIARRFPRVKTVIGDCQQRMDFADRFFDRIVAVHVLEHLPNLPAALREVHRLLNPRTGQFLVVIPTEGSPAYTLARKLSAERVYKRRYGGDYSWFYKREHLNLPSELLEELSVLFTIQDRSFFPLPFLPMTFCNLCIGLSLRPRLEPLAVE